MTDQPRNGKRHSDRCGISLIEYALLLASLSLLITVLLSAFSGRMNAAKAQHTLIEMHAITRAEQEYYAQYGAWPSTLLDLSSLLTAPVIGNIWGREYRLFIRDGLAGVETDVPNGVLIPAGSMSSVVVFSLDGRQHWRMTVPLSYGSGARLVYEKKYGQ